MKTIFVFESTMENEACKFSVSPGRQSVRAAHWFGNFELSILRDAGFGAVSATRLTKILLQLSGEIRKFEDKEQAETLSRSVENCLCS
jgi:hypothetical protein